MKTFRIAAGSLVAMMMVMGCAGPKEKPVSTTEQKIDSLLQQMTLEEKVAMIHANSSFTSGGVPRLGIPELMMSDGPHGVRKEHGRDWEQDKDAKDSATYLPTGIGLAATWNPELGYQFGSVLGAEARYRGKDVILGPGINIIRTPLNGRNFEYLSEDPYLISRMAVGYIKGVQDQGTSACVKHYLANNQETDRNTVNVEMSERTLREIYLPGFEAAVKEGGVYTLMGSYNLFRGQHVTHNAYLINQVLKQELGFQGAVISDWGAVHDTREAIENGTDLEMGTDLGQMPNINYGKFYLGDTVISLVKAGQVDVKLIDDKVRRLLRVMFNINAFGKRKPGAFNTEEHQQVALRVAEEGIVLLKNDNLLPLQEGKVRKLAIIGANADHKHAGAGGSSQVNAKYEVTALQGVRNQTTEIVDVQYAPGYAIAREAKADAKLIGEAVDKARKADACVIVAGWIHGYSDGWNDNAYDAEAIDKPSLALPFGQDELIQAVLKANPNTVVVLMGGGPADISAWSNQARAIIQAWYPGMEGGNALAKIIFGKVNPSGKLPITFPKKLQDSPAHALGEYPGKNNSEHYNEGIFVGYRYFDTRKVEPLFPFGFGLSYTTFGYEGLTVTAQGKTVQGSVVVKNTGSFAGAEVVQVYVKDNEASVERPEKELKFFKKVFLKPGESATVTFELPEQAFRFYDEKTKQWTLEPGKFTILVGSSSRDIRQQGEVTL